MVTDPGTSREMPSGETFMLIEGKGIKQLLAGTVASLKEGGKIIGTIYTGDMLNEPFAEEMEKNTGVFTAIYAKTIPEKEDSALVEIRGLNPTEEIIEKVFKEGKPYYAPKTEFNKITYHGFFQPLISNQGAMLGIIFFGIPRQYSFQTAISGQKFFPIITCLGIVMALVLGYTIASGITNPINSFVKAARAISSGDFNQKIEVRSRDEIGMLSAAFNLMTRRLRAFKQLEESLRRKERLAALGELSAGVAHEIRNPLSVIKNSAEIIRKKKDGQNIEELSDFIIEEVDRLNMVVNNLLEFARPRPPQMTEENIAEIMEKAVRIIKEKPEAEGVDIRTEYSPRIPAQFLCDRGQMEQVFLNILLNAIGAINASDNKDLKGEIDIRIFPGKWVEQAPSIIDYIYIEIKDNGCGIKDKDLQKIFNPFFTTKSDGTGLGLSIVHKIVENHEGEIGVESSPGAGTTVTIKLPLKAKI
jgi:signal transduction histidine kinase